MERKIFVNINDSKELEANFNLNRTFGYLLEYLAYNFPEENICPCFQFIDKFSNEKIEKSKKIIDSMTNLNQKIYLKNTQKDKNCHCNELIKKYFKKTKIEILEPFIKEFYRLNEYVSEFKKITENLVYENRQLKANLKMNSEINQIIKDDNLLDINVNDFYDAVINIKSMEDICKGWEIKMSERMMNNYEKFKTEKNIKIGVIGNSNKGKSFLLSKISKSYLPSGSSIRTEGLSFKNPDLEYKDKNIILLDSAGLETPVLKDDEDFHNKIENEEEINKNEKDNHSKEDFKDKSREKLITELFLQNYIINSSDILLIVVGILTYSEQKLINKIKVLHRQNKNNKPLFIIHNLMTFTSRKQVEEYINEYLLKSVTFTLEEAHKISTKINTKKGKYFYEKNADPKIFHLIYANEGSEAGNTYNEFSLEFLENCFQVITDLKPFDVIETIKNRFIDISKEIIENLEKPLTIKDFNDDK